MSTRHTNTKADTQIYTDRIRDRDRAGQTQTLLDRQTDSQTQTHREIDR